ncbi:hypothetical protein K491DRAFT_780118 [Lophiostoma macrostomum CBS 122681]|uniref:ubiquitinyl hydrolase 1 n=1 Tax=Lophiostoma macrostomum CBS 122681 TaxID=1314788 RepID=A0A6A6T176_9PLEO|nr:hypothetical protein K491DRAFT_780118 [Lophiostoma macrostomum CBS 122681]
MASLSVEETGYLIHHVVLPPKLPQADDQNEEFNVALLDIVVEGLRTFSEAVQDEEPLLACQIDFITSTIGNLRRVRNTSGSISDSQLVSLLHSLASNEDFAAVPLEVKAQNAAVLISKQGAGAGVIIEAFELSPTNEAVIGTTGRLKRSFPTYACRVSLNQFEEQGLIESLAHTLSKMSSQTAPGFQSQTRKNQKEHGEARDTPHPGLITDFFVHLLSVVGEPTEVQGIRKNTRDDILWDDTYLPWRRSPLWLLVRTIMQLHLRRISRAELYKAVMVHILARVLYNAKLHHESIGTDMLYAISAKLAGRLQKLRKLVTDASFRVYATPVLAILKETRSLIEVEIGRHTSSCKNNIDMSVLANLQPHNDFDIGIPQLDGFIAKIRRRVRLSGLSNFQPASKGLVFSEHTLPCNFSHSGDYSYVYLAAVEKWVEDHLPSWLGEHIGDNTTCEQLRQLIEDYFKFADSAYSTGSNIPRSLSIMYLTIMELWIACDKCACTLYPLLGDFDPEVDISSFQSLSLPFKTQLKRLSTVEIYLKTRRGNALVKAPSLYRDFGLPASFAVRFFDASPKHQKLFLDIEQDATARRQRKRNELAEQKQRYHDLKAKSDKRSCDYEQVYNSYYNSTTTQHAPRCMKCNLRSQADELRVHVHEWPLASNQAIAKATVFEARLPEAYGNWRDITMFVRKNVLDFSQKIMSPRANYTIDRQDGLSGFAALSSRQRVSLLSEVKPLTGSHYRVKEGVSFLIEEDVCVENALQYQYFDGWDETFLKTLRSSDKVSKRCTYQVPNRSAQLQDYLQGPTASSDITPNQVIASLSNCPSHFSLDEYKAFGMLSIGYNIQYQNLIVQLALPTVDLAKTETQCLILQMIGRAGPMSKDNSAERTAHGILLQESFCGALAKQIKSALGRVSENWETWRAVATLVQIILRMLSMNCNACKSTVATCLELLQEARHIALKWSQNLRTRLATATGDSQRQDISSRLTEIGLLCTSTFDTDGTCLHVILSSPSAITVLIETSILVCENKDVASSEHEYLHRAMLQSWRLLLFRALPVLTGILSSDPVQGALNQAVTASWTAFSPTTPWVILENSTYWIYAKSDALAVHLNLLTAELLVNGLPLSRLPPQYMGHHSYYSLFDKCPIEVMPTNEPGMEFSAKRPFHAQWCYNLSFGMSNPDMLILAARDGLKFDLVPSRVFETRLPAMFVSDYFHWYDHHTGEVEVRPRDDPWSSNNGMCRLKRVGENWRLVNANKILVSPSSNTGIKISKMLSALDRQSHIHVWLEGSSLILIELPRRRLDFHFTQGGSKIHSHQYQGMIIDSDQRIGTLAGLATKLILKHEWGREDRLVLIPEGTVRYSKTTIDHVYVFIELDSARNTHAYQVDEVVGRMLDNGNMQSKLFLCLLHAVTSTLLPDALTGHTGTEAALSILRSGALSSFDLLTPSNLDILERISRLTPGRQFYPANKQVMQRVNWDTNLSFVSQSSEFHGAVNMIFDIARKMKFLQPGNDYVNPPTLALVEAHLLRRDMIRTYMFRVDGFGAERYTHEPDRDYSARARVNDLRRGSQCSVAAEMIFRNKCALHSSIEASDLVHSLRYKLLYNATVKGCNEQLEPAALSYDSKWLAKPSSFLPTDWCNLHSLLATSSRNINRFDLMTWLSTIAFSESTDMNVIQVLAAFYNCPDLASVQIPSAISFELAEEASPSLSDVEELVQNYRPLSSTPESSLPQLSQEQYWQWNARKENLYHDNRSQAARKFAKAIHIQWPSAAPTKPSIQSADTYLDTTTAMSNVHRMFKKWHDNHLFYKYLEDVSHMMARQSVVYVNVQDNHAIAFEEDSTKTQGSPCYCIKDVFNLEVPIAGVSIKSLDLHLPVPPRPLQIPIEQQDMNDEDDQAKVRLVSLLQKLTSCAESSRKKDYIEDLQNSCDSLGIHKEKCRVRTDVSESRLVELLKAHCKNCQRHLTIMNDFLRSLALTGDEIAAQVMQCPRISPTFWLGQLNRDRFDCLTQAWKKVVITYGLAITELHRARRLLALSSRPFELAEELRNTGHQNWSPMEFPETLLLEAENGLLVREVQEEIAKQMRHPPDDKNSVMQLNMGEGKSSVIVPIIASFLSQGKLLVRVIVAKPQSRQMFQMLVSKLGGLLNRRIYHMPFSRALTLSAAEANAIGEIYQECMANRGIMLVQPEHILSFKLMGIECLLSAKPDVGRSLLRTQNFFDTNSRDIVDESDENFSVKFELVYTMGTQRPIDLSPERWIIIHSVLELVMRYAAEVKKSSKLRSSIEFDNRLGSRYPRTRILRDDAEEKLLDLISEHICKFGVSGLLSVARQPQAIRKAVLRYIRNFNLTHEDVKEIEEGPFWTETTQGPLLVLRGLIAGGVLSFALRSKRWRVNYGIDPSRTPKTQLAVPYRSKDNPSPRSEFSHPDVVITLTSLTYYYGGLEDEDLFDTFAHLLKSDQADVEYYEWIRWAPDLPKAFQHLTGVNIKDRYQCITEVFPSLRYSKGVIDYFLSHIVFCKAMKEFPHKLTASGWDLGAVKSHPTTGFSGTNDSRQVLPLSVHYLHSDRQKHTNALVLAYLLQDENSVKLLPPQTDAESLLNIVVNTMTPPTRVILDAGAQILELNNFQVAETWLRMSGSNAKAVIFFNDNEELSVLDHSGRVELLQTSPFAKQLDECLVYLDQAHTRGTDLKMPKHYRAAVTLGANLTKDTLVQACMRMRKLGKGQSVIFCIPEEIQNKILERTAKRNSADIDVSDVLTWTIAETWADMRRSVPLWATQGVRYETHKDHLNGAETTVEQAKEFLEKEAQTLEDRYQPRTRESLDATKDWDTTNSNIKEIVERCRGFGTGSFNTATLQEEQERELSPEIEEEREIQRPAPMKPLEHKLHVDLVHLVERGTFTRKSPAFISALYALRTTSAAKRYDVQQFPRDLLATVDFMSTVLRPGGVTSDSYVSDSYLRPVQWILSVGTDNRRLVIISPFEAEQLLPAIRKSSMVTLHLYAPRPTQGYDALDTLDLYCVGREYSASSNSISRSQIVQLNLFAGQLYFKSHAEYVELCKFLGLAWTTPKDGEELQADGFVVPPAGAWGLKKSPVGFLREYVKMRREGEGMEKTHLGRVLEGGLLEEREFTAD